MNKTILFVGISVLALLGVAAYFYPITKTPEETPALTEETRNTEETPNEDVQNPQGRYMDIESYVRTNINEISTVEPVLGGTFYVTNIETHGGAGTVEYEDGHIALTADFTYTVDENGKPEVTTFTVREE